MRIGAPKEGFLGEARVAMTPESALQLQKLGHACVIEAGAGEKAGFSDAAYTAAGVSIVPDASALYAATAQRFPASRFSLINGRAPMDQDSALIPCASISCD